MRILRSILPLVLILITTLLVSCSGGEVAAPPTYTPEKVANIQVLASPVRGFKERMSELEEFINTENWIDARTFIHGPLGGLRQSMTNLSRSLLPKDEKEGLKLAKELFNDFEKIDAAAKERDIRRATNEFDTAVKDFDSFLDLIPSS